MSASRYEVVTRVLGDEILKVVLDRKEHRIAKFIGDEWAEIAVENLRSRRMLATAYVWQDDSTGQEVQR